MTHERQLIAKDNRDVLAGQCSDPHTVNSPLPAFDVPQNHLHNDCSKSTPSNRKRAADFLPWIMLRVRSLSKSVLPSSPFNLLARRSMMSTPHRLSERPAEWKKAAPQLLFEGQAQNLPRLPVPKLEDTVAKLKESLVPIAWSKEELDAAYKKIDKFAATEGPELQKRLQKRAEETPHWLEQWWDDTGYLGYRDSVVINVSYYYGFDAHPAHLKQTPANRAAALARAAMTFRKNLKAGLIKSEGTKEGQFCMDTYRWMFDCCRIPGPQGLDWSTSYAKDHPTGDTGHIIVFRKNRVWKVDVTKNGRILSTDEIERQIQHIYDSTHETYPGVGVLPASNRDVWAADYTNLAASPKNASILKAIESAAFTISLDTTHPTGFVQRSRALWHGDVVNNKPVGLHNRWVDKPVEFIVYDNMEAGIMGEHSVMDGTPTVRLCDDVLDMLADKSFDHGAPASATPPTPTPLDWEINSTISQAIEKADKAAVELITDHELGFLRTSYGKAAIKKFGVSPDSWAQMIVQLAYRRLIGPDSKRIGGTYEAATTRKFFKGRTETIRVVTSESDAWVRSMDDPKVSKDERKQLLMAAAKKHVSLAKAGGQGLGADRHMFGLKKSLKEGEAVPDVYSDPAVGRSSYWALSTSAIFSKHFEVYGWGEVVPDGFGVAYMTGFDNYLQYTITSRKDMPNAKFCDEISRAAKDIYDLYAEDPAKPKL